MCDVGVKLADFSMLRALATSAMRYFGGLCKHKMCKQICGTFSFTNGTFSVAVIRYAKIWCGFLDFPKNLNAL